jgi:hypothetical protein
MGALPTEKVQLFLSYVDLMPAPLAKYGNFLFKLVRIRHKI